MHCLTGRNCMFDDYVLAERFHTGVSDCMHVVYSSTFLVDV